MLMAELERVTPDVLPTNRLFDVLILSGGIAPDRNTVNGFRTTRLRDADPRGNLSLARLREQAAVVLSGINPNAHFITSARHVMMPGVVYPLSDARIMRDELVEDGVDRDRIISHGHPIDTFTEVLEGVYNAFLEKKDFLAILTNQAQIDRAKLFLGSLFDAERYQKQFELLLSTFKVRFPELPGITNDVQEWQNKINDLISWQKGEGERAQEWKDFSENFHVAFLTSEEIIATQGERHRKKMEMMTRLKAYRREIEINKKGMAAWEAGNYGRRYLQPATIG